MQPETAQFVQPKTGQLPKIVELTALTNHIEILCRCKSNEERMFYILYANKEHLVKGVVMRALYNGLIPRNPFALFHISPNVKEREYLKEEALFTSVFLRAFFFPFA